MDRDKNSNTLWTTPSMDLAKKKKPSLATSICSVSDIYKHPLTGYIAVGFVLIGSILMWDQEKDGTCICPMHNDFFSTVTGYLRCSLNICNAALKFLHLLPTQHPRIIANITRKKFDIIHDQNPYCSIGYIMQSNTRVMGILEKQPNIQIQRPLITQIQTRYIVWVFSICFKHILLKVKKLCNENTTPSQKSCRHCNLQQKKKRVSVTTHYPLSFEE